MLPSACTNDARLEGERVSCVYCGPEAERRARNAGLSVGDDPAGPTNSIVDVRGVRVGHSTVTDGRSVFSGVTAIVIDGVSPLEPVRAGVFVGNGYGKLVGSTQVDELGRLETPIVLTSTLSAFRAADAVVTWILRECGSAVTSVNPVVGEINDSWLSSALRPVTTEHVLHAIDAASAQQVAMGNVGGGTGACALGFKGGIGSSSRVVRLAGRTTTLGALVQINMDGRLRVGGRVVIPAGVGLPTSGPAATDGSCMIVIGIDAPLDSLTLRRMAARAVYALARVGARFSHGSGDYGIAFSSVPSAPAVTMSDTEISEVFEATMDAVEESVLDALLAATSVRSSNGNLASALPLAVAVPLVDDR